MLDMNLQSQWPTASLSPRNSLQFVVACVPLDLVDHETHQLFGQVTVQVFARRRGSDVRARPIELIEFGSDDPGPLGIQAETPLGSLRNFYSVFILKRRRMRDGQHIRDGIAGLGDARKDDAARAVLCAVLATTPRFISP